MNHDIDLEKRMICLCHSNNKTPKNLNSDHFYNTKLGKIYSVLKSGNQLETEVDFKKHDIDDHLLYECLSIGAFSELEMPTAALKLIGLHKKREEIKRIQSESKQLESKSYEDFIESEDGYDEFIDEHDDIRDGVYELLETPWYKLTSDSRFTEGKAITVLCGDPGVAKSFFTIQLFSFFALNDIKAICWFAEDDKKFATRRAFAQYIGKSGLCDYEFLRHNHERAKITYKENKEVIDKMMSAFYCSDNVDCDNLITWCREKAMEGYKIVGIDPITQFSGEGEVHKNDKRIMNALNNIRKKYGTRFFIVTHPRESAGTKISQDGIAGGRAVSRFAQNILWLVENDDIRANRKIYTLKTRNGRREFGGLIEFNFSGETVRFEEV